MSEFILSGSLGPYFEFLERKRQIMKMVLEGALNFLMGKRLD
jgi:hypothetical protein